MRFTTAKEKYEHFCQVYQGIYHRFPLGMIASYLDKAAVEKALIHVEDIKGPVLLLSATKDEMWGATPMSEAIIARLKLHNFAYHYEHIAIEGGHATPLKHFDKIFDFLANHFK